MKEDPRSRSAHPVGAIAPIIDWPHYDNPGVAPLRRSRFGSIVAIRDGSPPRTSWPYSLMKLRRCAASRAVLMLTIGMANVDYQQRDGKL
jgi:hypothetical protein